MQRQNRKLLPLLAWLLPSGIELIVGSALCAVTIVASNAHFLGSFVFLPSDFHLKSAILDSLNNLVVRFVGDQIARSAIVAIFWAIIGLFVYIFIWLTLNFSSELGNDLAITKYVHPKNVDIHSPLRNFLSRVSFQFITLFVFIFYLNVLVDTLFPYFGGLFRGTIREWFGPTAIKYAAIGIVSELVALHFCVVLIRALLLRKRVFG